MALLIDPPLWPAHGRLWSHLVSDASVEELHAFAARAGMSPQGFEGDHYDVPEERYAAVVAAGAEPTDSRLLVRRLRDSGLRIPKRRHERVVASVSDPEWLPAGSRADVIASRQDSAPPRTVVVRLAVHGARGVLVVDRADGRGSDLPSRVVGSGARPDPAVRELEVECGLGPARASLLGYVRNTVPDPDASYPWPAPTACFAVYAARADEAAAHPGRWCPTERLVEELGERHWWPLLATLTR